MRVAFRVDASPRIGTGHVVRCARVAWELQRRGAEIEFVCREHPGRWRLLLENQGFSLRLLPAPPPTEEQTFSGDYGSWLGVSQREDADETVRALRKRRCDLLVVDHYGLDNTWERVLRPHTARLMAIDDIANRIHDCDVLLDQNYSQRGEERYRTLVPDSCQLLLGPRYALLASEYRRYRPSAARAPGESQRIFVFLGGSDEANVTGHIINALSSSTLRNTEMDVVVGVNNPHRPVLEKQVASRPGIRLYPPRPHLADLMAQADLAVGAGGVTTWERICVGLPSAVIAVAENQVPGCEALAQEGLIAYLGRSEDLDLAVVAETIEQLFDNPDRLRRLSESGKQLVDGWGTTRVAELLCPTEVDRLELRDANDGDVDSYFAWANDRDVRRNAISTDQIPWSTHVNWFEQKLRDPSSHLFLLEASQLPVGQIRFDETGDRAVISYALDPLVRGRRWGAQLVRLGVERLVQRRGRLNLVAQVRSGNDASARIFERCGFTEVPDKTKGFRRFTLAAERPILCRDRH